MKRTAPLNTGKVLIGLHWWPRRSAQYATPFEHHTGRRSSIKGWIAFAIVCAGAILAAAVIGAPK